MSGRQRRPVASGGAPGAGRLAEWLPAAALRCCTPSRWWLRANRCAKASEVDAFAQRLARSHQREGVQQRRAASGSR